MLDRLRLSCTVFVACIGAAYGQTSMPSASPSQPTASTRTTATQKSLQSGEIYRWVDSQGKIQYSADVPEDRRSTARKIDTRSNIVSSRVPARNIAEPQPAPTQELPVAQKPISERQKCDIAWRQYEASQACFAKYRQGTVAGAGKKSGSNLSAEAFEQCQAMDEPAACR